MKRQIQFVALAVGVLILAAGVLTALYWSKRTVWPQFPQGVDSAPQMIVEVEPDFSWRTGDLIPVHIYIKQQAGTSVDLNNLELEGDFEPDIQAEVYVLDRKDGRRYIHINAVLQSFKVDKKLGLQVKVPYLVSGQKERQLAVMPVLELHTSLTWDGRQELKDGPLAAVQGYHYVRSALWLVAGLGGFVGYVLLVLKFNRRALQPAAVELNRWERARVDFDAAWQLIDSGVGGEEPYRDIVRIIRRLYHIESRTVAEIPWELGHNHPHMKEILLIMRCCEKVLFSHATLTQSEKQAMRTAFDTIVMPSKKKAALAGKKPTRR